MRRLNTKRGFLMIGVVLAVLSVAMPVSADTTYNPPSGTWNGKIIYVSQACHDGNDGVPGGPCLPNYGCSSYNENIQSSTTSATTIFGVGAGSNLLERGFKAIRGNGTLNQNVSASNAAGAHIHIPQHTNAKSESCSSTSTSGHGTLGLYRPGTNSATCATLIKNQVGPGSPGTSDGTQSRYDLGEINSTSATACYVEAEYHTWNTGVTWIRDEVNWTWRVGWVVDTYLGYP